MKQFIYGLLIAMSITGCHVSDELRLPPEMRTPGKTDGVKVDVDVQPTTTGECVPSDDPCADVESVCGEVDDGCGQRVTCGTCHPAPSLSPNGVVCIGNRYCGVLAIEEPAVRRPESDSKCRDWNASLAFESSFVEAWTGFPNVAVCETIPGTNVQCCTPTQPCAVIEIAECKRFVTNCTAVQPGCMQVVENGRYRNDWCCNE